MEHRESNNKTREYSVYRELAELEDKLKELTSRTGERSLEGLLTKAWENIRAARLHIVRDAVTAAIKEAGFVKENTPVHALKQEISLEQALWLTEEIKEEAKRLGVAAVIAIADKGARPIAVQSMEEAYIASFDIALNKAYTSAALKMSTIDLKSLSQPGGELYGIQNTNESKIVIFGGGEPLFYGSTLLGGLGVSGGTEAQDTALAAFGREKWKEAFKWS